MSDAQALAWLRLLMSDGAERIAPVELDDIQGLVRFGYKHHTEASFLLLRVSDRDAARRWLATVPVSTRRDGRAAARDRAADRAHQRRHARARRRRRDRRGLRRRVRHRHGQRRQPRAPPRRRRRERSRAAGNGAPARACRTCWCCSTRCPAARRLPELDRGAVRRGFERMRVPDDDRPRRRRAVRLHRRHLAAARSTGSASAAATDARARRLHEPELPRRIPARLSERVRRLHRPAAARPGARRARLPRAEDAPDRADLGRNGSYLVLRQLRQDVHGFWQFVDRQAGGDAARASGSPSAMVGRRRDGVPARRPGRRSDRGRRRPRRPERLHLSLAIRTACAARSARTCGAAIRATPTCRPAAAGSSRGRSARSASTPRRSTTTWSHRRAFIACCAAAASTAPACRSRRRSPSRRRARETGPALHLPRRQHRAPVRVRAERVGDGHPLRRPAERERSAARHATGRRPTARPPTASRSRAPTAPTSASPGCRSS